MSTKQKAINGGKWVTIATAISTIFQFLQVTILARLLDPSAFGVVSVSTLIINFFHIFANLGFSNSIIYKQEDDKRILSTLYYLNILLGVFVFVAIYFSSPLIISYYKEPRLDNVIKLASLYFIIVYFGQIYSFLLQKELKFKSVAIIEIVATVLGTGVTILMAYSGSKELSLIYGQLASQIIRTILQISFGYKYFIPTLAFDLKAAKEHLQFGIYNVGDGLISYTQSNIDRILIGGMLGVKSLGFYTIAYQLAVFPVTKLNPIILQVAYPAIAKMKDNDSALKQSYVKILDFLSYCIMPLLAGLFITADSVIPLVYGPGWEETVSLTKILVFVSFCTCLTHPLFTIVFTKGKPNLLFYLNLITLIIKIPLVYVLGDYLQATGIAIAFLIAIIVNMFLGFGIAHSLIGSFFKEFYSNILKPTIFCLVMVFAISVYKYFTGGQGLTNTLIEVAIGGAIYATFTLLYKVSYLEIKAFRKAL